MHTHTLTRARALTLHHPCERFSSVIAIPHKECYAVRERERFIRIEDERAQHIEDSIESPFDSWHSHNQNKWTETDTNPWCCSDVAHEHGAWMMCGYMLRINCMLWAEMDENVSFKHTHWNELNCRKKPIKLIEAIKRSYGRRSRDVSSCRIIRKFQNDFGRFQKPSYLKLNFIVRWKTNDWMQWQKWRHQLC